MNSSKISSSPRTSSMDKLHEPRRYQKISALALSTARAKDSDSPDNQPSERAADHLEIDFVLARLQRNLIEPVTEGQAGVEVFAQGSVHTPADAGQ